MCMYDRLYQDAILVNNRWALGIFKLCYTLRDGRGNALRISNGLYDLRIDRSGLEYWGPVSWQTRLIIGPVKPFLFHPYLKVERCIHLKRTSVHIKNMWIKQLCCRKVRDFAVVLRARKVSRAFEKRASGREQCGVFLAKAQLSQSLSPARCINRSWQQNRAVTCVRLVCQYWDQQYWLVALRRRW